MGCACSGYDRKTGQIALHSNAVLSSPIKGLTKDLHGKRTAFLDELEMWVERYQCKAIIAERYQNRGIRGTTVEEVTLMLGFVIERFSHLKVKLITAATWKNDWHRKHPDEDLKELYKVCQTAPHQLDATLIGFYGLQKLFKHDMKYSVDGLLEGVASVSQSKLYKRKAQR